MELVDCQDAVELDLESLRRSLKSAWEATLAVKPGFGPSLLQNLDSVEITILNDAEIARIHGEFFGDPTPTDVITFQHGEILTNAEFARREAASRGWPAERELLLYIIHGLLHLHGHDDRENPERQAMHAIQEAILERVWPRAEG